MVMDARTKAALEQSIIKWEKNLQLCKEDRHEDIGISAKECPLCLLFYDFENYAKDNCCRDCPVEEKANDRHCKNTPYEDVIRHSDTHNYSAILEACQAEVDFLRSLLPSEE